MSNRTAFHLDCNPIIPECGFECPKCIQEIESTLTSIEGVNKVYMEGEAEEGKLIVEHNPAIVTVGQLIEAFKELPSFYEGFFIPSVIT
jgi:copper chaperone CopZ